MGFLLSRQGGLLKHRSDGFEELGTSRRVWRWGCAWLIYRGRDRLRYYIEQWSIVSRVRCE